MTAASRPSARRMIPILVLSASCGCHERTISGDESVWRLAPWIMWGLIGLAVALFVAGPFVIRRKEPVWPRLLGGLLLTVLPLAAGLGALAAASEYVKIDNQRIEIKRGAFGEPTQYRFKNVQRMEFQVRKTARIKRSQSDEMVIPVFILKDGTIQDVDAASLRGPVLDDLVERLKNQGIPVVGDRRGL